MSVWDMLAVWPNTPHHGVSMAMTGTPPHFPPHHTTLFLGGGEFLNYFNCIFQLSRTFLRSFFFLYFFFGFLLDFLECLFFIYVFFGCFGIFGIKRIVLKRIVFELSVKTALGLDVGLARKTQRSLKGPPRVWGVVNGWRKKYWCIWAPLRGAFFVCLFCLFVVVCLFVCFYWFYFMFGFGVVLCCLVYF